MPKDTKTPTNQPFDIPPPAPQTAADEAKPYHDSPTADRIAPDNLYDAIRAEVGRHGGGFYLKPLKRYRHRSPKFPAPNDGE